MRKHNSDYVARSESTASSVQADTAAPRGLGATVRQLENYLRDDAEGLRLLKGATVGKHGGDRGEMTAKAAAIKAGFRARRAPPLFRDL